eukprot:GHRQ01032183.1.p2 GENE.GHRQ01032183.1~~GHRQ01032183.1.p2  ORF type:complete len:122 (+),score=27.47 GHRQ01032183.1:64-429(+)
MQGFWRTWGGSTPYSITPHTQALNHCCAGWIAQAASRLCNGTGVVQQHPTADTPGPSSKPTSTPKAVKNVARLRVSRYGTTSMRSTMPLSLYSGSRSSWNRRPLSLANRILLGERPDSSSM